MSIHVCAEGTSKAISPVPSPQEDRTQDFIVHHQLPGPQSSHIRLPVRKANSWGLWCHPCSAEVENCSPLSWSNQSFESQS